MSQLRRTRAHVAILAAAGMILVSCSSGPSENGDAPDSSASVSAGSDSNSGDSSGVAADLGDLDAAGVAQYSSSSQEADLEACAAAEGSLHIYTARKELAYGPVVEGFKAKYPKLSVDVFRDSSSKVANRLDKERKANASVADVVSVKRPDADILRGNLVSMNTAALKAFGENAVDPDHRYVVVSADVSGVAYNTDLISESEAPKSTDDLLDAKWDGKIVISSSLFGVLWTGYLASEFGEEYIKKAADLHIQGHDVSSPQITALVAAGDAALTSTAARSETFNLAADGAPIAFVPIDSLWQEDVMGMYDQAKNPCAARLFVDYALSQPVQEKGLDANYISARTDVATPEDLDVKDVKRVTDLTDKPYYDAYAEWLDILTNDVL